MTTKKAEIKISAIDDVTKKLKDINSGFQKILPTKKFSRLIKESGIGKIGEEVKSLGTKVLVGGGIIAGGIFGITKSFGDMASKLHDLAPVIDLSTQALQEFYFVGEQNGVAAEELNGSFIKFTKSMGDLRRGAGPLYAALKSGNPHLLAQLKATKNTDQALMLMLGTLHKIPNAQLKASLASAAFGRSYQGIVTISNEGADGITRLREEAQSLGLVLSKDAIEAGNEFDDTLNKLMNTLGGVKNTFGAAFAPELTQMMKDLIQFIKDNRPQIQEFAKSLARELPEAIRVLTSVLKFLLKLFTTFDEQTGKFEVSWWKVKTVLSVLTALLAGPSLLAIGGFLLKMWKFFELGAMLGPLLELLAVGFELFWVAVTGPVGLIILAITALIGLGVLLYNKFQPFKNLVDGIWATMKEIFGFASSPAVPGIHNTHGDQITPRLTNALATTSSVHETRNESQVKVSFENMPKGARIESTKKDPSVSIEASYLGANGMGIFSP